MFGFVRLVSEAEFPNGASTVRYRFVHVLYQNALYASLHRLAARALNAAVARVLMQVTVTRSRPSPRNSPCCIHRRVTLFLRLNTICWRPGRRRVSLLMRKRRHLANCGLALLDKLPDDPERARLEIRLRSRLVGSLTGVKGHGASEVLLTHHPHARIVRATRR